MRSDQLKKMAINVMIASLVGAAAIAVIAVLAGSFTDVLARAMFTLFVVTIHALACLGFLDQKAKANGPEELPLITNTVFILIVLSFLTAVFGIWGLLTGSIIGKLYATYFVVAFATLHGEMLNRTTGLEARINKIVYGNYVSMGLVVLLLLPVIWSSSSDSFPDFYYRLLAAVAIVDATLTILAVILHKLYLQKHPKLDSQLFIAPNPVYDASGNVVAQAQNAPVKKKGMHPLLIILIVFLGFQFVVPVLFFVAVAFSALLHI